MTSYLKKPFEYSELSVDGTTPDRDVSEFAGFNGCVRLLGGNLFLILAEAVVGVHAPIWINAVSGFIRKTPDGLELTTVSLAEDPSFEAV